MKTRLYTYLQEKRHMFIKAEKRDRIGVYNLLTTWRRGHSLKSYPNGIEPATPCLQVNSFNASVMQEAQCRESLILY